MTVNEKTVRRLRISDRKRDEQEWARGNAAGNAAGKAWAGNLAEVSELRRLEAAADPDVDSWLARGDGNRAKLFVKTIKGDECLARQDVADFWTDASVEGKNPSDEFVTGFAEGAMEVWGNCEGAE